VQRFTITSLPVEGTAVNDFDAGSVEIATHNHFITAVREVELLIEIVDNKGAYPETLVDGTGRRNGVSVHLGAVQVVTVGEPENP